jgi:tetratricopeptide (TPR) repeat protein
MKKAVTARCTLVGGILLTFALTALAGAEPAAGRVLPMSGAAMSAAGTASPEKQKKLDEALQQGARSYKDGDFERAIAWYKSAIQLEPSDAVMEKLRLASKMRDARERELKNVPSDPKAREQFLARSYDEAQKYYANKQYEQAGKLLAASGWSPATTRARPRRWSSSATRRCRAARRASPPRRR